MDSQYAIAIYKARAMEAVIMKRGGCTVLSFEDSPIADNATRMPGPLNMQGWQVIDGMNRAFAEAPWSGCVPDVLLVTAANAGADGGDENVVDPGNGYRDPYSAVAPPPPPATDATQ